MNVLLIESQIGEAASDAQTLADDGHVVFRCFPDRWGSQARNDPLHCIGVTEGACPLDCGIDVAVMHTSGLYPTIHSAGSLCAMRRGIPVAEVKPGQDVIAITNETVQDGFDALRNEIRWRIAPLLSDLDIRGDGVDMAFETLGPALFVTLRGPALPPAERQRLASRVADAVAASRREFSKTSVAYVA